MSTFLQLAQRLRQECGVSGTNSTVTGASGEWLRLCDWIATAWTELQEENPEWEWMRKTVSFSTTANQGEYTPVQAGVSDFGSWRKESFRIYLTSSGVGSEWILPFRDYNGFRDFYLLSSRKMTYSRPTEITIAPNKNLILGLAPNDIYTVSGEYFKTPIVLAADADTPDMPVRFHMAIVYKAMMSYGAYEAAPEVYQRGELQLASMLSRMRLDQMPTITRGSSLI